jgi:hypothetical protein
MLVLLHSFKSLFWYGEVRCHYLCLIWCLGGSTVSAREKEDKDSRYIHIPVNQHSLLFRISSLPISSTGLCISLHCIIARYGAAVLLVARVEKALGGNRLSRWPRIRDRDKVGGWGVDFLDMEALRSQRNTPAFMSHHTLHNISYPSWRLNNSEET